MKTRPPVAAKSRRLASGFALVVSLSMMVMLVIIAVGLLSLSSISLRNSSQTSAMFEAQANARLALMIAIGELQKQLGPDQRVSSNGAITSTSTVANPHWTGVWDSWIAGDLALAPTNPNYPSDPSQHQTIGSPTDANLRDAMHPDYDRKDDHFRRWLVSLNHSEAEDITSAGDLVLNGSPMPDKDDDSIRLVGAGSTVDSASYVSASLIDAPSSGSVGMGRYAWWIGDESQKARVMHDSYASSPPANDASRIHRIQAPGSTGTNTITDLEGLNAAQDEKLTGLPSMKSLKLIPVDALKDPYRRNFHSITSHSSGVLADVREGGLKRDLSVLLERPIDAKGPNDNQEEGGDEFMLYAFDDPRFSDRSHSRVPIQDLAAYHQLYDDQPVFAKQRREGVRFTSSRLPNSIQISAPNFDGGSKNRNRVLREYTSVYRQPVITKVQFMVGLTAEPITDADRTNIQQQIDGNYSVGTNFEYNATQPIPDDGTAYYKLRMGIMPMVTLWNPTNLPVVMNADQVIRITNAPPVILSWRKYRGSAANIYESRRPFNLSFVSNGATNLNGAGSGFDFMAFTLQAPGGNSIVFNPGEVKIFSVANGTGTLLTDPGRGLQLTGEFNEGAIYRLTSVDFLPDRFFKLRHSTNFDRAHDHPNAYVFTDASGRNLESTLIFNENDRFTMRVNRDNVNSTNWNYSERVAAGQSQRGAAFSFNLIDPAFQKTWTDGLWILQNFAFMSRHGASTQAVNIAMSDFNAELLSPAFPGGAPPIPYESFEDSIKGSDLIGAGNSDQVIGLMDFSISMGCEAGVSASFGAGRRIASRPFIHSGLGTSPFIDRSELESLYDYGWDWRIGPIVDINDSAIIQAEPGTDRGYFGGGYSIEAGTTHVVQREIPVLPPISIASLSHAQLGGYSLAYATIWGDEGNDPTTYTLGHKERVNGIFRLSQPFGVDFQKTIATGLGGLAPQVQQAIGNSYAHPNLPPTEAFTVKTRHFDGDESPIPNIPFVDHSYLANKALWDDYFFSSISPQPGNNPLFGGSGRNALQVAQAFFFGNEPLPNRRIKPHTDNLNPDKLEDLFTEANDYTDGLADKISAYLMVDGAFNINSTSVEAWKVLLSSLQGKPVAYLDGGVSPKVAATDADNTPFGTGILPGAEPVLTADINTSNQPPEQWLTGRVLTEVEIDELANAIVNQVKLRGPFLSLSEFINRRLDDYSVAEPHSMKGALQAALDDPGVSINANFRKPLRVLDGETSGINFAFPAAATGPVAYGSMPYVDQADVLQHFSEQLTPRGDTFVVRSYGDALDPSGKVIARAWCEAVIQRTPEYSDPSNEPHEKLAALTPTNRDFGRKMKIIGFRWLHPEEV